MRRALRLWWINTRMYAYWLGYYETRKYGGGMGCTHPTDQDWNEAYDRGMNLAERVRS